jgi:hypothetical protein
VGQMCCIVWSTLFLYGIHWTTQVTYMYSPLQVNVTNLQVPRGSKWDKYGTEETSEVPPIEDNDPNFTTSWREFAGSNAGKSRRG